MLALVCASVCALEGCGDKHGQGTSTVDGGDGGHGGGGGSGGGGGVGGAAVDASGDTAAGGDGGGGGPTATAVCGTTMLSGPPSAPAGAVVVSPGASTIQTAIGQHPNGGTTYYLTAGTYAITSSINPNNNDTFVGAPGAIVDGSSTQPVAFGFNDHASGVTIKYLTIQHFAGPQNNGIVNQGQGAGWTLQYNTIQDNPDTSGGAAGMYLGDNNNISYNCFSHNGEMGIGSAGASGFVVDHNEIAFNAVGYEAVYNCGCSGGIKFFDTTKGIVTNNWIHDNGSVGLWIDTNNSFFLVQGNVIEKNYAEGFFYEISYNAVVTSNVFRQNNLGKNSSNGGFPNGAVYISESGGFDTGAPVMLSGVDVNGTLAVTDNLFDDNANGVVLWQNATRCCGPSGGCDNACSTTPLYSEVDGSGNHRWNTQNVVVENNRFSFDASSACVAAPGVYCNVNAMFSNDTTIDQAIALHQNNLFRNNSYSGAWRFLTPDQGSSLLAPAAWQAAPYNQDQGSTFR